MAVLQKQEVSPMLRKITVCLMAILGSSCVWAASANNEMALPTTADINVIAPYQSGSWSFGAEVNYFKPNNDFNYAMSQNTAQSGVDTANNTNTDAVKANYNWGWGADVTYHFAGYGRDVTLAFSQLNSNDNDSVVSPNSDVLIYPTVNGRGTVLRQTIPFTSSDAQVTTDYDAVDLTFGQLIDVGHCVSLHPFAGLRYAYLNYKADAQYVDTDQMTGVLNTSGAQTIQSNFQGVGPRLGSDAEVRLGSGFSLHGALGVSLLVGTLDASDSDNLTDYNNTVPASISSVIQGDHTVNNNTRVVPEIDGKLAAMYRVDLNNSYALKFELGYQATDYVDAIQNNTLDDSYTTSSQYTNFFMQGPYARVQLDVA